MHWVTTESPPSHRIVGLDFETTGLNPEKNRIVQIGVAVWEKVAGFTQKLELLVNPEGTPLTPGAADVNKLTDAGLKRVELTFADVHAQLAELTENALVIAHRLPFEIGFWASECARINVAPPPRAALCSKVLAGALGYRKGQTALDALSAEFNTDKMFPAEVQHHALADATQCVVVARHLIAHLGGMDRAREAHDDFRRDESSLSSIMMMDNNVKDLYMNAGFGTLADLPQNNNSSS